MAQVYVIVGVTLIQLVYVIITLAYGIQAAGDKSRIRNIV